MSTTRRSVLRAGALTALGVAAVGVPAGNSVRAKAASTLPAAQLPKLWQRPITRPEPMRPVGTRPVLLGDREVTADVYRITAREGLAQISPRVPTRVWGYEGTFPGPLLEVERNRPVVVRMRNQLPAAHPTLGHAFVMSTHLHGHASRPQYDGYANDLNPTGFVKEYVYENADPARSIWYHDHAVHKTSVNVYSGLAGQYLIHDDLERSLLPQGRYDVPLLVSDCILGRDGDLLYDDNGSSGLWGDVVLVNGVPWPFLEVEPRLYRFRIVVGSVSRSYNFRLSTGAAVHVVGTDGGLVPRAQRVTSWRHGNGERYEVLIDFRGQEGRTIELRNASPKNNVDYDRTNRVLQFRVGRTVTDDRNNTVPDVLAPDNPVMRLTTADAVRRRHFRVHRSGGQWVINDETWADVERSGLTRVQANPDLGDVEIWTFENSGGGWFHPMHTHLVDYQVLSRNGRPPHPWERGPKDTVYVGENEVVRVLAKFGPHCGRYMIHCHNAAHEDHDMMVQFSVGDYPGRPAPDDPVYGDPPRADDEDD